jgi:phosphoserine aminotransferase
MLDYKPHVENGSMYNTPSVFAIFVCMHTLRWIKEMGLEAMEVRNKAKANLLYAEIDRNPLFEGTVVKEDRSRMNVNFVTTNKEHEAEFLKFCESKNLSGLKGHRSVGGLRASLYNALPIESVQVLVDTMKEFEALKNG